MVDGAGAGATLDVGVAIGVGVVVSPSKTPPPTPAAKAIASALPASAIVVLVRDDIERSLVVNVLLEILIMSPIAQGDRAFRPHFSPAAAECGAGCISNIGLPDNRRRRRMLIDADGNSQSRTGARHFINYLGPLNRVMGHWRNACSQ